MGIDIRLPNITETTAEGQMSQMQSYMHQLVQQLNWALNNIDNAQIVDPSGSQSVQTSYTKSISLSETDARANFNAIKSLIINSADIVEAYYQMMRQNFDGEYVANSDFGTFVESTNHSIENNSTATIDLYNDVQNMQTKLDKVETALLETDAWIKRGLLDYDEEGIPIYGIEVGQTTEVDGEEVFDRFARFTADGIYFYLPGSTDAVAWMSGNKLYISNAEITGSLKLGGFDLDLTNGIICRWV